MGCSFRGISWRSTATVRFAIAAHFEGFSEVGDWGEMHVERDVGYVGFASVGNGLTNVSLVVPQRFGMRIRENPALFLEQWLRARPQLAPRVLHARRVTPVL